MSMLTAARKGGRKIRQIAASDLAWLDKLRYASDFAFRIFRRRSGQGDREFRLAGGGSVKLREASTDGKVFEEIFIEKIYAPFARAIPPATSVVLIDLGANIGLSAIALARELDPRAIVAVEPDRGNFAMLEENLRLAGIADRSVPVRAFAGAGHGFAELVDSGNGAWGMRMGAPAQAGIPVLPVEDLVSMAEEIASSTETATGRPAIVLKCDIEGAEASLFRHLNQWEDRVHRVILELHTEFLSARNFHACLAASRYHWKVEGAITPGAVLAVIGLERLELKAGPPNLLIPPATAASGLR